MENTERKTAYSGPWSVEDSLDLLVKYGGMDPAVRGKAQDWVTLEYLP